MPDYQDTTTTKSSETSEKPGTSDSHENNEAQVTTDNPEDITPSVSPKLTIITDDTETPPMASSMRHNNNWAGYISTTFSPLLLPTYCMAVAMWITPLNELPEGARFWSTMMVLLITGLIPMAMILGLIKSGHVQNLDITNRHERIIPLTATGLCYIAAGIYLYRMHAPQWLTMLYLGNSVIAIIYAIISPFWKISGHGGGMGALIGMLVWLDINNMTEISLMPWITVAILITGIVGSARVYLNKHSVSQVITGIVISGVLTYIAMNLTYLLPIQEPAIVY